MSVWEGEPHTGAKSGVPMCDLDPWLLIGQDYHLLDLYL